MDVNFEMSFLIKEEQKDWPKYRVGSWAPGNYQCKCSSCKKLFIGDKRASLCYPCAKKEQDSSQAGDISSVELSCGQLLVLAREALEKLNREQGDAPPCFCEVAIGNPMLEGKHTPSCLKASRALLRLREFNGKA